jgi:hypothetical protein
LGLLKLHENEKIDPLSMNIPNKNKIKEEEKFLDIQVWAQK